MIHIENLHMHLHSGHHPVTILNGVTLSIPAGQRVAVVGPSGSGKSTLLGLIAGLDSPTSGSITVSGIHLTDLDDASLARFRREHIGYIFQSYHLIPTLTAQENVALPLELRSDEDAKRKALTLLETIGLADRTHHYPVQLSGGEQQRVAIARAFANRPPIILADEPTGNLDSENSRQVIELLLQLNREHGSTLLLVTHDAALTEHANRVVTLRDGRIVLDEPLD